MRCECDFHLGMLTVHNKHWVEACLSAVGLVELEEAVDSQNLQTAAIFVVVWKILWLMEVFSFAKRKFQKLPLQRVHVLHHLIFSVDIFAFWHSCLSERKHPTLTSYSRKPQLPPSDFAPFCRMNRYLERFNLPHTQPFAAVGYDKSHAVSGHMESPSSVYMLFHFWRITHAAYAYRVYGILALYGIRSFAYRKPLTLTAYMES